MPIAGCKMRSILLILSLFLSIGSYGKSNTKEFIKLIKRHDIPSAARNLSDEYSATEFWNAVLNDNPILLNLTTDIEKEKGAEQEALRATSQLVIPNYKNEVDIIHELKGFCDTLIIDMGLPSQYFELNIVYDHTPNAYTIRTKNGKFAICLNHGLIEKLGYDYARIMAVTAHEFAHGAFFHHLRTEYEVAKKKRKDKVLGGIAMTLHALAAGADAYTSGVLGREYDSSQYTNEINKISRKMKMSSIRFRYKYRREEELEADLIALRFMQFLGYETKYQEALNILANSSDYFWYDSEFNDHPSIPYRLEFLDFVTKNPQYYNEVKVKNSPNKKKNDAFYDYYY